MIQPGEKYGMLTVLKYAGKGYWLCQCDCGRESSVYGSQLTKGLAVYCGCKTRGRKATPIEPGTRFGKLTVLTDNGKIIHCYCDCGNEKIVSRSSLLSGNTRSCGCLRKKKV